MTAPLSAAPAHRPTGRDHLLETLETELTTESMGGRLTLRVISTVRDGARAEHDLRGVAGRIAAWAGRLTRFAPDSDLSVLNAVAVAGAVALRPTIAAVLAHAHTMSARTEGAVDVAMLDARCAAETGGNAGLADRSSWHLEADRRHGTLIRHGEARFDLDGVAKGWIADRALRLLEAYSGALVDADGDVAVRAPRATGWRVAVVHPHDDEVAIARLGVPPGWPTDRFGVATSGTSVHRWDGPAGPTHHLIDPLTGRSAVTDVVQATVVAESTGVAECLAKAAVIRGSEAGLGLLERGDAWAALLCLENGDLVTTPGTSRWLS